jgi:hypothetical protein
VAAVAPSKGGHICTRTIVIHLVIRHRGLGKAAILPTPYVGQSSKEMGLDEAVLFFLELGNLAAPSVRVGRSYQMRDHRDCV